MPLEDVNHPEKEAPMGHILTLHIEKLPEGVYLATSDVIQGLVAQGRTIQETIEIARDVAPKILEAKHEREGEPTLPLTHDAFDHRSLSILQGTAIRLPLLPDLSTAESPRISVRPADRR